MARGIFLGLSSAQITAIQMAAVEALTSGKVRTSISTDGVSIGYTIPSGMSPTEILEECAYATNYNAGTGPRRRVHSSFRRGGYYPGELAVD